VICRCSAANASGQRVMRTEGKQDVDREEESLNAAASGLARTGLPDHSNAVGHRDLLYLFACHVEWSHRQSLGAHQELVAALDDSDQAIRAMAEMMLHRYSPRPRRERRGTIFQL
jgi:hypothetical protein